MSSEWPVVRLGDVVTIDSRQVGPQDLKTGTKYLGLENLCSGGGLESPQQVVDGMIQSAKFRFDNRHVLFGKLRPNLAKVGRPTYSGVCSTDIWPLRPGPLITRDYLAHFLLAPASVRWVSARTSGANLPRISSSVLLGRDVPLPPLPEQRRIAAILDQADALRQKRRTAGAEIDRLTEVILSRAFNSASCTPTKLKALIVSTQNGLYKPGSFYGSGVPVLRIADFQGGDRVGSQALSRVRLASPEVERYQLAANDIVINRVNALSHLGKAALVVNTPEPTIFESNMMRLRLDESAAIPRFVLAWLSTSDARRQIIGRAKKAINQASVNQSDVSSLTLPLPSIRDQAVAVGRLEVIDDLRATLTKHLAKLDELFASLQHRAFRGEL